MLKHRWHILALLLFTRGTMGFQFQSISAFAPLLGKDLALSPARLGGLIGLYMLPGVLVAIPAAFLGRWLGGRRAVLMALALLSAGGFGLAASASFGLAAGARLVGGAGMALLNVLMTKMVADHFAGKESATAMALLLAVWPAGIALALATLGGLATLTSWQLSAAVTGAWPLVALAAFTVLYRDPAPPESDPKPRDTPVRQPSWPRMLLLGSVAGWAWTLYNCGLITLISFAPSLLQSRGVSLAQAGLISSLITWGTMLGTPLGGVMTDWFKRPTYVVVFASLGGAVLIAFAAVGESVVHFLLMGLCIGLPTGPIMAMLGETLPEHERGLGYGVLLSWYYLGLGITPALAGWVQQVSGFPLSILALSGFLVVATMGPYFGFRFLSERLTTGG